MFMPGMQQMTQNYDEQIQIQKLTLKIVNFNLIDSPLTLKEINWIINESTRILKQSPTVLNLSLPIKIVGDVYGHYTQLAKIFQTIGSPAQRNYLFLGNYVGKGTHSIQSLITLLFFKIKYPENFFLLRGRSEIPQNNFIFSFYDECATKYNHQLWNDINQIFNYLPLAALIDQQIFSSSSGIVPQIKTIQQLNNIHKTPEITQIPQIITFLTSKPKNYNIKKSIFTQKEEFTHEIALDWMRQNNLTLMIRSNQLLEQGMEFSFKGSILSICSIPNLLNCGNLGVIVSINQDCQLSFTALKSTK